jgi:hypothetical protein
MSELRSVASHLRRAICTYVEGDNTRATELTGEELRAIARAIIPLVLEEAAKVAEHAEAPFDEHMDCQMCHGFDTAAAQIAAAIRAIGAP